MSKDNWYDKKIRKHKNGCWIWLKSRDPGGYGHLVINGKLKQAHRISYESHKGPIPDGLVVCHTCDVRRCINPDHLFLGTKKDNAQDCLKKGRFKFNDVKLTPKKVQKIRDLYATGKYTQRGLAGQFGVSKACIWDIVNQNHWQTGDKPNKPRSLKKITLEIAEQIRSRYQAGGVTQRALGKEFGLSQQTICDVVNKNSWHPHAPATKADVSGVTLKVKGPVV